MGLLPGKVTVITGAGRGLGKALALRFAREGSSVVLAGRSYDLLEKVCDEIRASGGEGFPVRMDVRDPHSVAQAVEEAASRFGRIDVLINNSGISMVSPSESLSYEDWKNAIDTNLSGVFFCSRAVAMHMIDRGISGCIINISQPSARPRFRGGPHIARARRRSTCSQRSWPPNGRKRRSA